jgi:hypothetical protein
MQLAHEAECAVLATASDLPDLPEFITRRVDLMRVVSSGSESAATATLFSQRSRTPATKGFSFAYDPETMAVRFRSGR